MSAEGSHRLVCLTLEVQGPSLVCACDGPFAPLDRNVILANNRLAVEDKERDCFVGFPAIKVGLDVCLNTCQTTQSGEKRLMEGRVVEKELEIVRCINGDGTILKLANVGMPSWLFLSVNAI